MPRIAFALLILVSIHSNASMTEVMNSKEIQAKANKALLSADQVLAFVRGKSQTLTPSTVALNLKQK